MPVHRAFDRGRAAPQEDPPRAAQEAPRTVQETPRTVQDASTTRPKAKRRQEADDIDTDTLSEAATIRW